MSRGEDYTLSIDKIKSSEEQEGFLKELILNSLRELGILILDIETRHGEGIGLYALAILNCDARQALECWLRIVDKARDYGIPIFVMWTGNVDVSPEEMSTYIGRALAKMNVFPATREPLDIVKTIIYA
ncbi:MAG: hypothetical protein ACXQTI_10520 [Candidatus Nezhaarchaeales archaeon]